jgi:hypothetical protein
MIKTTPPGRGSRLLDLGADDAVLRRFATRIGGVQHLAAGEFDESDIGVSCFHAKTGAVELYLNHLVDGPGEYVVVDMTAGADAFASGLFTRFDLTVLVCEPTRRGVGVYRQYAELAAGHGVALRVLGNKVAEPADVDYLRDRVGDGLLGWLVQSSWVRAAERGALAPIGDLEPANRSVLETCWPSWTPGRGLGGLCRDTVQFHLRNAAGGESGGQGGPWPAGRRIRARSCTHRGGRWTPTRRPGRLRQVHDRDLGGRGRLSSDRLADGVERGRAFVGTISRTPCSTGVQQSRSSGLWLSTWPRGLTNSR